MTIEEEWREGMRLGDAWFALARPELQEQLRNVGPNLQRMEFLNDLMKRELNDRILNNEICCAGVRVNPGVGKGPEPIPAYIFSKPKIDWQNSVVRAFKRVYEDVRVIAHRKSTPPQPKRMGRPTITKELAEVVQVLRVEGQLKDVLRKEQINRVRVRARKLFPHIFRTPNQPSRNKILEALQADERSQSTLPSGPKSSKSP
jgi:hypothetical protein